MAMKSMADRPADALVQDACLGQGKAFVLATESTRPIETQAEEVFRALARTIADLGGWLVDDRFAACEPKGFAQYMRRREEGELRWDRVCPHEFAPGDRFPSRPILKIKQPYTMLTFAGYPCWAVNKHLYTIDLFNPANELLLPYSDPDTRLWSVWFFPPSVLMPSAPFAAILGSAAMALGANLGFGGRWLAQAIYAYRFAAWSDNNYLKPLDPGVRLTDLSYPHMLLRAKDLGPGVLERLRSDEFSVQRAGRSETMASCDQLGPAGEYAYLRLGPMYPDANDDLVMRAGQLIGKPYVKTVIVRG